jgi:hypothetical protein
VGRERSADLVRRRRRLEHSEAEQRGEARHRVVAAVETEDELVEVVIEG